MIEDPFERSVRRAGMPARTGKPHLFLRDGRWWSWRPGYRVPVTAMVRNAANFGQARVGW